MHNVAKLFFNKLIYLINLVNVYIYVIGTRIKGDNMRKGVRHTNDLTRGNATPQPIRSLAHLLSWRPGTEDYKTGNKFKRAGVKIHV